METEMRDGELIFVLTLKDMDTFTRSIYDSAYKEGYQKGEKDGRMNYILECQKEANDQRRKKIGTKG